MTRVSRLCLALALVLVASAVAADDPVPSPAPHVSNKIRDLMQDRSYAEAIAAIDEELAAENAPKDELSYLKARGLQLDGKHDLAIAAYETVEREFPESPWVRRSRFGKAISLMRKGDFRAAEVIYRSEAEFLLSAERKQEIADIYLEFAHQYFKPADERVPPDYAKALEFFRQALEVGPQSDKRAEVELLIAQCHQNLGQFVEAAMLYQKFSQDHPGSTLDVEARYRLGECQLALGQTKEARRTWQDLAAAHPNSPSERMAEAAFNISATYGLPQPQSDQDLALGVASLEAFLEKYPEHKLAGQAHLRIAQSQASRGRYEDAVASLTRFLGDERYADREEIPNARNLLGASYQLQKKFTEAIAAWRDYLAKHPAHDQWSQVQQAIVNTEYLMGAEERQAKHYEAARKLWDEFLAKYPLDPRNPAILFEFGSMNYDQEQYEEALADWRRLVSKYPGTEEAARGQFMIGATLEEKLGKLAEALKEYQKVTWGQSAYAAQQRIAALTAKSLAIVTERVFRGDETPRIKVTTRNIEAVTVRAYVVDLETYFRKMHLAQGVEGLDIALIDPDKDFEFKVPDYAEYQQVENEIEIEIPRSGDAAASPTGVVAVTVSSPTLEATTLVVQSDLEVIVKGSRDEVFVFAQNMRTGEPWAGARLLLSNGSQVFAEAETGPDGVYQSQPKELKDAADVRVFAIAEGSVASNVVDLSGIGVAQGLADKGYIYTDRPAYRAGQMVHVRGVLRKASGDTYTVEEGKKYNVEIYDPRSRLVHEAETVLTKFGSFHEHFPLPPTSVQGEYRVLVHDEEDQSHQGTFTVHEYQLEPVHLGVETDRTVYYRGEEIEGKIVAKFYYGAPLAGRDVTYQLADGRSFTAKTDENGEVPFKLPTRDFLEAQTVPLVVTLPERNLQIVRNFFLATQAFTIQVDSVRPVYLAGETFEVRLTTNDTEGEPTAQKLALKLLEQTTVDGKVGERLVEEREVSTDDKGKARVTLRVETGGRYFVRAEGIDRFKNPVTAQYFVQVSDDSDEIRLRILADRHTFKAGETAEIQVHWRDEPALALVTYQGARVLGYQLVRLATGANAISVPMTAQLAPNFELSIAAMTDSRVRDPDEKRAIVRFHTASSPIAVERDLIVKIETQRSGGGEGPVRPGEDLEVTLTVTDPQGNPVSSELSLAMIEQSLLEIFGRKVSPIGDFFRGGDREAAVRTASSITFTYAPTTQNINPRLLAERDRLEVEADEMERLRTLEESGRLSLVVSNAAAVSEFDGNLDELVEATMDRWDLSVPQYGGFAVDREALGQLETRFDANGQMPAPGMAGGFDGGVNRAGDLGVAYSDDYAKSGGASAALGRLSREDETSHFSYAPAFDVEAGDKKLPEFNSPGGGPAMLPATRANIQALFGTEVRREIVVLTKGRQSVLHLGDALQSEAKLAALGVQLAAEGAVLLSDTRPQETGYWNPSVVTDENGKAVLTITMPERSTAWHLEAVGITEQTLAGEAATDLTVKKDLFGELKLPLAFTDGDTAEILATVHNDLVEKGQIKVTLKTTIGEKSAEETRTIDVSAKGLSEVTFTTPIKLPEANAGAGRDAAIGFELTVSSGETSDVVRRSVPVRPYGMPVFATSGGSATSDATAWVEPPAEMPLTSPGLEIVVGPTVERSLLDVVLGPTFSCQFDSLAAASSLDAAVSDLMASIGLIKLLETTRDAGGPQAEALDSRIRSSLGLLIAAQNDDGGWSWTGQGGSTDRFTSARVTWALSLARKSGYSVPADGFDKALAFLAGQFAATGDTDYETRAILLHALSTAGQGDFALANRLHRNRPSLSSAALAYLALAFTEMDRDPMAQELLDLLATRNLDDATPIRRGGYMPLPWCHSPAEIRALYALAVQRVNAASPKAKELVDWLMANRSGQRWSPEKATGPAMLALTDWFARTRFDGEHYQLAVFVNEVQVKVLEIDETTGTQTIAVPAELLKEGKQRVNFTLTGRGRYTYQVILGGFVAADKLKGTTKDWHVRRYHEPAPLEFEGQEVPRGFGILVGSYTTFRNPLTQLPVGKRGHIQIQAWRDNVPPNTPQEQLEYLVITEPLPSGVTVIEQSVRGGFERFEVSPGAITFYVGSRQYIEPIEFDVHGYLPGQYKAGPTVAKNAFRLDQIAVADPKQLTVLPLGAQSADEYRFSPQELYELGKRNFESGDFEQARPHLADLFANWNLNPDVYKDSARMLLDIHLEVGPPAEVVKYFEIVKEKWPDLEVTFEKIFKVAAAYDEIGEYERSYLVFRATVESSFVRESGVAGFLEAQNEFRRSIDVMSRFLAEYPPEPYVAAAHYALAQRVYAKAPLAAADPKLREKKINRVDLIRQALAMLDDFLTQHPDDPAADQASFSVANALLDLEQFELAIAKCDKFAERYPKSDYLDSFWYVIGYCHFALGEHEEALAMCRKVVEATRTDPATGRVTESPNKWRAVYILGQVYHSLGQAAEAIAEYTKVADRFLDAAQAIAYFSRKEIALPEVTTVPPGEAAEVELAFRNIAECDTKVYKIDLMKFSLLNRDLAGITRINLAGIRPYHEANVPLGDGKDYRDRTQTIPLPLTEEGAYLVVCRGADLHASGLVLVTPLVVEVQEEVESGRVRATVKDTTKESYLDDVHVKVIGTRNADFVAGETDLRGVFVADAIQGISTVIAQAEGGRYAFFRGETELGPPPTQEAAQQGGGQKPSEPGQFKDGDLLEGLRGFNEVIQQEQHLRLQRMYEDKRQGVEAQSAF